MRILFAMVITFFLLLTISQGQTNKLHSKVQKYHQLHQHQIIKEYFEFLSIPNVSRDKINIRKNAKFIVKMMHKRGIKSQLIETKGNPVVYGEFKVPNARQTIMIYAHYDGQPVDPGKWIDTEPFKPVFRPGKLKVGLNTPKPLPYPSAHTKIDADWRVYARAASDDKGPIVAMLAAIDAIKNANIPFTNNIKFIFDGEEEMGSSNLKSFCEKNKELLKSDILFICDGPGYFSGDPTLFFGVRGITTIEITTYGAKTNLHSGHYGNWAPNPAIRLIQLLASMKDNDGMVIIKDFYGTVMPLSREELKALKAIPLYDKVLKKQYGFSRSEGGISLMEAIQLPSLNVRGLESGWIGKQARTIIPSTATVSIDIRLVKGNKPKDMRQKVINHIKSMGYYIVEQDPEQKVRMKYPLIAKIKVKAGYRASRTSMDLPISQCVIHTLKEIANPVLLPTLGGSLPIYIFEDILNVPVIGISTMNYDNNQHQPNENMRIGNLWAAIETIAAVMMTKNINYLPREK